MGGGADIAKAIAKIDCIEPINQVQFGDTNGVSLSQTVTGLTVGSTYVLEFWTGGEDFGDLVDLGIFGLDIGFGYDFLETVPTEVGETGKTYIVIFNATSTAHTIKFTNWGHVCSTCTELTLDLVRLYTVAQLDSSVYNCGAIAINGTTTIPVCDGQCTGTAYPNVTGGNPPLTFQWSTGDTTAVVTGLCAGTYVVTVTDFGGMTATATMNVTTSVPNASFNGQQVAQSLAWNFTPFMQNASTYSWDFGDGGNSTAANPTHIYANDGTYIVSLSVIDSIGCVDSLSDTIQFISISVDGTLTLGGDPYPNPFTDKLQLSLNAPSSEPIIIELQNELGQTVLSRSIPVGTQKVTFSAGSLPKGIYTMRVTSGEIVMVRKIVRM